MKKFVVKTTKEFTYDEKGFITKEVVTEESYEQEVHTGGTVGSGGRITSGTISSKDISGDSLYVKVTGDNPTTAKATFENCDPNFLVKENGDVTVTGNLKVNAKSVSDIANEVKAILERDLRKGKPF